MQFVLGSVCIVVTCWKKKIYLIPNFSRFSLPVGTMYIMQKGQVDLSLQWSDNTGDHCNERTSQSILSYQATVMGLHHSQTCLIRLLWWEANLIVKPVLSGHCDERPTSVKPVLSGYCDERPTSVKPVLSGHCDERPTSVKPVLSGHCDERPTSQSNLSYQITVMRGQPHSQTCLIRPLWWV